MNKCKHCGDEYRKDGHETDDHCSTECYWALKCRELEAQVAERDRVIELLHEQWPYRVEWAQAKAKEVE